MLNRILLIGRLVQDPDLRYTPSGVPVAKFTLAIDRPFKRQDGGRDTDFIDIVAWRQRAEFASNYLSKGRQILVEGRLEISSFTGQDGVSRRKAEVVADNFQFVGPRPTAGEPGEAAPSPPEEKGPESSPEAEPREGQEPSEPTVQGGDPFQNI